MVYDDFGIDFIQLILYNICSMTLTRNSQKRIWRLLRPKKRVVHKSCWIGHFVAATRSMNNHRLGTVCDSHRQKNVKRKNENETHGKLYDVNENILCIGYYECYYYGNEALLLSEKVSVRKMVRKRFHQNVHLHWLVSEMCIPRGSTPKKIKSSAFVSAVRSIDNTLLMQPVVSWTRENIAVKWSLSQPLYVARKSDKIF